MKDWFSLKNQPLRLNQSQPFRTLKITSKNKLTRKQRICSNFIVCCGISNLVNLLLKLTHRLARIIMKETMLVTEKETLAPDFALTDLNNQTVRLSDFLGRKNVILVFNRGFA